MARGAANPDQAPAICRSILAKPSAEGWGAGIPSVRASCNTRCNCASPRSVKLYPEREAHPRTTAGAGRPKARLNGPTTREVSSAGGSICLKLALDFESVAAEIENGTLPRTNSVFVSFEPSSKPDVSPLPSQATRFAGKSEVRRSFTLTFNRPVAVKSSGTPCLAWRANAISDRIGRSRALNERSKLRDEKGWSTLPVTAIVPSPTGALQPTSESERSTEL